MECWGQCRLRGVCRPNNKITMTNGRQYTPDAIVSLPNGDSYRVIYKRSIDAVNGKSSFKGNRIARMQGKKAAIERANNPLTDCEKLALSNERKIAKEITKASRVQCIERPRIKRRKSKQIKR